LREITQFFLKWKWLDSIKEEFDQLPIWSDLDDSESLLDERLDSLDSSVSQLKEIEQITNMLD